MASITNNIGDRGRLDAVFRCLSSRERRRLLGILHDRAPESLTRRDLATAHLSADRDEPEGADDVPEVFVNLYHTHLPKLEAAGLIERDSTRNTMTLADHPAFADAGIVDAIEGPDADPDSLDALFGALADSRRRAILDVLSHQFGPIHVETLARELEAREQGVAESEVPAADVESALVDLHHAQLPRLSAAGLIEHDPDEGRVVYEGHPKLRVPWMHSVLEPSFRPSLTGESNPSGIGDIQGRERVVSFGQSLFERADDELFCMVTDTDLLKTGCLTRVRNAADRGVDVYLGTRDPTVREYVRENAPEVILWEPDTDWLNLPAAGDRVGRLVLADREAVMLGTLLDEPTDYEEQAIVGEGDHDTLVTMISQLVAPHLEEIDADTPDVQAHLPL